MKRKLIPFFLFLAFAIIVITINKNNLVKGEPKIMKNEIEIKNILYNNSLIVSYNEDTINETDLFHESDEIVEVFNSSNCKYNITRKDLDLMAKVVFAESKGEPYDGKVAVASVILNRLIHPNFPNTIQKVITQKNAFSCVVNGNVPVVPDSDSYNAVREALKGNDPSKEALYFYNPKIATCSWMKGVEKLNVTNIGQHVFFTAN
ncbi:cell wall hydrolase [Clostridium tarantellae]|uniref:Cell wall hydrolase n=1 Tax=Clostridium tarantellae TaxID=39493 RepID=A0A6I1MIG4_9CLOT|nr:cell wall hydrolase [Clostridium tarantellae]MPQ43326.1 cell wall hydrolase [Clostridium tarantellae]